MELRREGSLSEGEGAGPIRQNRSGREKVVLSPDSYVDQR